MFRPAAAILFLLGLWLPFVHAGQTTAIDSNEIYFTGFDEFTTGDNMLAGYNGWTGSSSHLNLGLTGIDAEADHLVTGIGNAAFIGGNATPLAVGVSRTVNVRHAASIDPVTAGREVVQFRVNFGIKDSTVAQIGTTRRDNFEFAFYNQSSQLIGFIQFDNSTIDTSTSAPGQYIHRSRYNGASFEKVNTGAVFYYDVLMELMVRINFRTNRWTASLDGVDIFSDEVFYTGPQTMNLGLVAAQMQVVNSVGTTPNTMFLPGDNYMLFDDFAVRADPVPAPLIENFSRDAGSGLVGFTWQTEALYRYQVQYSTDLVNWKSDLSGSSLTATATGVSPVFSDSSAPGKPVRYYRVVRSLP